MGTRKRKVFIPPKRTPPRAQPGGDGTGRPAALAINLSALEGRTHAGVAEVAAVAPMVMAHRIRSQPGQRLHDVSEVARRILGES